MSASSIEAEWRQLCAQIGRRAQHASQIHDASKSQYASDSKTDPIEPDSHADQRATEAREFIGQPVPGSYGELISRISIAEELIRKWDDQHVETVQQEQLIDETSEESFPASDPPPWGGAHA